MGLAQDDQEPRRDRADARVMEKCTFCIQRIEQAKIAQKVKAGRRGDVIVPRDSFTTACAQACPAGAIVFGNLNEPESRVSKLKKLDRDYTVLEYLLTKPAPDLPGEDPQSESGMLTIRTSR